MAQLGVLLLDWLIPKEGTHFITFKSIPKWQVSNTISKITSEFNIVDLCNFTLQLFQILKNKKHNLVHRTCTDLEYDLSSSENNFQYVSKSNF